MKSLYKSRRNSPTNKNVKKRSYNKKFIEHHKNEFLKHFDSKTTCIQYVRDSRGNIVSAIVAVPGENGEPKIGIARTHPKDSGSKIVGRYIALRRAQESNREEDFDSPYYNEEKAKNFFMYEEEYNAYNQVYARLKNIRRDSDT